MPNKNRALYLYYVFPVCAVLAVAGVTASTLMDVLPLWLSIPLGLILGVLLLFSYLAVSGTDFADLIVGSMIILVLIGLLWPIASRARYNKQRELQQLQQRAISPKLPNK